MNEASRNAAPPARILVADDDPDVLEAVRDVLQPHWTVAVATSGSQALAVAETTSPDLVLTDVMMPGLDGFELLERLRQGEHTRHIPVVMLSALSGEDARVEGLEAGAEDYLVKPFSGRELVARIRTHLELSRSRRAIEESEERFRAIFESAEVSIWEEDCSELKVMTEQLAAEHGSGLRDFLESSPAVLAEAASLIRVRDVNPASLRMFGATRKEELTRSVKSVLLPESLRGFVEEMIAIAEGRRMVSTEVPLRTLHGERLSVQLTKGLPPPDHSYDRVLTTLTDISAATGPREARLAEMERAVRFSEMLTGVVGHDLRSPLSAIMMAAQLVEARCGPDLAAPARRILTSAERMERMISQLLDFTRIRLGRGLPLERGEVDLAELCRVAVEEAQTATCGDIRLAATGDCRGEWDRDRLWQLVSNLVTNACEHGVPIAPVSVHVDGSRPEAVSLGVCNRGEIPRELLPILFEPLHRRRGERSRSSGGLGLGLYISQQIVLAHGGTIRVGSDARHGTTFTVTLPRRPPGQKAEVFAGGGA